MSIANTCDILHNRIDLMQQNGDFRDEVGGADLITNVLYVDEDARKEAAFHYEETARPTRSEIMMDSELHVVRWMSNDMQYTDYDKCVEIEEEVITCHAEIGHDVWLPIA